MTQIGRQISTPRDSEILQKELDILHEWVNKWQMNFNKSKCSILHIGRHNLDNGYEINGTELRRLNSERDLGVLISQDLRPRE